MDRHEPRDAPAVPSAAHLLLALAVVAVWGSNFVVIKVALRDLPPLAMATLRFTLAFVPAAFFVPRPAIALRNLASYGLAIGVGQFGLLYLAMRGHISPGLASLVIQSQVFFTIAIAMRRARALPQVYQLVAVLLAALGIGLVLAFTDATTTPLGLGLVLLAALSWAYGNLVSASARGVSMLAYVVWSSAFAIVPLALLSLLVDGWAAIRDGCANAGPGVWLAVLWQAWGNTLFGYGAWSFLLARYPASTIAPTALLVPIFGIAASALLLHEPMPPWKLAAAALVLGGLVVNLRGARRTAPT